MSSSEKNWKDSKNEKILIQKYNVKWNSVSASPSKLRERKAIDLPDILHIAVRVLQEYPQVVAACQRKYRYILVDEFQDTNQIQLELLTLIGANSYVTVCGDDDQAIYGWRGASSSVFTQFKDFYKHTQEVTLRQNYRSSGSIVGAAECLIRKNINRTDKSMFTENPDGPKIEIVVSDRPRSEARDIISLIQQYKRTHNLQYRDIAILYRLHRISMELVFALQQACIPHTTSKKKPTFAFDQTVRAVLAYMKLGLNRDNDEAFLEIYNVPKRGFGKVALTKLKTAASEAESSLYAACQALSRSARGKQKQAFTPVILNGPTFHICS